MAPKIAVRTIVCCVFALLVLDRVAIPQPVSAAATGSSAVVPDLDEFADSLVNGNARTVRGVYAPELFALTVVQQPYSLYVSKDPGTVTQFALAATRGVVGLLAHNWLSGAEFFNLEVGDRLFLTYGDGRIAAYWVAEIQSYRATTPDSPYSHFIDLKTGKGTDVVGVIHRVYTGHDQVTLQTCIARDGILSWGRLFVIAKQERPAIVAWRTRELRLSPAVEGPSWPRPRAMVGR
jgi:hypothetical protein